MMTVVATTKSISTAQFGLRASLVTVAALAILFAVCVRIPRPTLLQSLRTAPTLVAFSALFALVPLTCINFVCVAVSRLMPARNRDATATGGLSVWAPHRLLWQAGGSNAPSFRNAMPIAFACTLVLCLLWSFMRDFGLAVALILSNGFSQGLTNEAGLSGT